MNAVSFRSCAVPRFALPMKMRFLFSRRLGRNWPAIAGRSLLLAILGLLVSSCSSGPKMGMDAEGQPVEHKVFYEGWGWKKKSD